MRLLASADVHGDREIYEWLLAVAQRERVDAIVLAGDLLGCPDGFDTPEEAQRHDADLLVDLLEQASAPVLYIMGNDDLVELDSRVDRVRSVEQRRASIGKYSFVGYQYSLPFMGGTFEKPDAEIAADLERMTGLVDADTVFVSHSPAFGILDPGIMEIQIGSRSLLAFLDAHPFRAHIHGHSHGGFGRDGRHFNVAAAARWRAIIVDLETMGHRVVESRPGRSIGA